MVLTIVYRLTDGPEIGGPDGGGFCGFFPGFFLAAVLDLDDLGTCDCLLVWIISIY